MQNLSARERPFPKDFATQLGEEDDFSIRCRQAGYRLRIADRALVLHAKSKSFTPQGREKIVAASKEKMKAKHGTSVLKKIGLEITQNEAYLRSHTFCAAAIEAELTRTGVGLTQDPLRIGWLQPHLKTVGGIRRCIEMSNRLQARGHAVTILTPDGEGCSWLPLRAEVAQCGPGHEFDVLILSDPDMVEAVADLSFKKLVVYHLAAYHIYRDANDSLDRFYADWTDQRVDVTNSSWTASQVADYAKLDIAGVFPGGIDKKLFRPMPGVRKYDCVYYGSKRIHKGSKAIEEATHDLKSLALASLNAPQEALAGHICEGGVFVSGAWHEGFNFCPLEAMACGVPVVMTDCGGSREYAVDETNALVVPVEQKDAMRGAVDRVLNDQALRARLIENGILTAWQFNWDEVTRGFAELIEANN